MSGSKHPFLFLEGAINDSLYKDAIVQVDARLVADEELKAIVMRKAEALFTVLGMMSEKANILGGTVMHNKQEYEIVCAFNGPDGFAEFLRNK